MTFIYCFSNIMLNIQVALSFTCVLLKIMERLIVSGIIWYIEINNLSSTRLVGFRKFQLIDQQVIFLSQSIKDALGHPHFVLSMFLDFETALDRVWRLQTICKPQIIGTGGKKLLWIKAFLSQRLCATRLEDLDFGVILRKKMNTNLFTP